MDDEKKLTALLELYKIFKDCMERSKKHVLDTYRIYIPALFGILVAIDKIGKISQNLENVMVYIIPIIGIFILISYAQVVYDLTDVICLGVYLWFIEQRINKIVSEDVAFWEEKFGEPLKMIAPKNWKERLLKHIYVYIGPVIIAIAWIFAMIGILGINIKSIVYSSMMFLGLFLLTHIIGHRRLKDAEEFYNKLKDC